MEIKGIIWVGSATDDQQKSTEFFSKVLGMPVVTNVAGFSRLAAANGDRLEFFGPDSIEHSHLDTGPVAGLWVDDCEVARAELLAAGVEVVTDLETGRDGHRWFYFKAPDGHFLRDVRTPVTTTPKALSDEHLAGWLEQFDRFEKILHPYDRDPVYSHQLRCGMDQMRRVSGVAGGSRSPGGADVHPRDRCDRTLLDVTSGR